MLWNALLLAVREIRRNVVRSALTVLGIVIGVAAVITMVTVGEGATLAVRQRIADLGSNLLIVRPGQSMGFGRRTAAVPFTLDDAEAIGREINAVAEVSPTSSEPVMAIYGNANWLTTVTGADNRYFVVRNWTLADGRLFSENELRAGRAVCIIGDRIRRELFGRQEPVGDNLRLAKLSCQVVGVLESKGESGGGRDQDDLVLVPLRTFWRRIAGNRDVDFIQVSGRDGYDTAKVKADIESLLRERRRIAPDDPDNFTVRDLAEIADALAGTTQVLTALLGSVAAVSLLVGGIGIMNIMLVSVTERTREIGIRLAIGALAREVLLQFLVEAVVLSSLGGVFGIVIAVAASFYLAGWMEVPFAVQPSIVALAFLFSAGVGIVFGFFPARRAAQLDPIEALRHE